MNTGDLLALLLGLGLLAMLAYTMFDTTAREAAVRWESAHHGDEDCSAPPWYVQRHRRQLARRGS